MKTEQKKKSGFKDFLKGYVSAFDLSGRTFLDDLPDFSGGFERDARALAGDWQRVGGDFRVAMNQMDEVLYGKPKSEEN